MTLIPFVAHNFVRAVSRISIYCSWAEDKVLVDSSLKALGKTKTYLSNNKALHFTIHSAFVCFNTKIWLGHAFCKLQIRASFNDWTSAAWALQVKFKVLWVKPIKLSWNPMARVRVSMKPSRSGFRWYEIPASFINLWLIPLGTPLSPSIGMWVRYCKWWKETVGSWLSKVH